LKKTFLFFVTLFIIAFLSAQQIALLQYRGGGDWYANPTSLKNLIAYSNQNLKMSLNPKYEVVEVGSGDLYRYPFVHLTGHGNVVFSDAEAQNLRNYLIAGGFLHIDDNYGLDAFIRREMKKVFPEFEFIELPFNHPVFHQKYEFPNGLPKIHEHDNKPPQAFALFWEGRLVCLYTYETDLGDGWEDYAVHKDSETTRTKALQMGANILMYVFTQ
jgi:hypothetical protein